MTLLRRDGEMLPIGREPGEWEFEAAKLADIFSRPLTRWPFRKEIALCSLVACFDRGPGSRTDRHVSQSVRAIIAKR